MSIIVRLHRILWTNLRRGRGVVVLLVHTCIIFTRVARISVLFVSVVLVYCVLLPALCTPQFFHSNVPEARDKLANIWSSDVVIQEKALHQKPDNFVHSCKSHCFHCLWYFGWLWNQKVGASVPALNQNCKSASIERYGICVSQDHPRLVQTMCNALIISSFFSIKCMLPLYAHLRESWKYIKVKDRNGSV